MDIEQIIKARYKELPKDIQQAIQNTDLASKFQSIANKHNLHIDQNGAMQTETILVMLGLEPTDDYVGNLEKNLEISRDEAMAIAQDVNTEILNSIRNSLREMQETQEKMLENEEAEQESVPQVPVSTISDIEKAGDFQVEKQETPPIQHEEEKINRDELIKHIEGEPVPMIDHLLQNPVSNSTKVEIKKPEETKKYTTDPYREQI